MLLCVDGETGGENSEPSTVSLNQPQGSSDTHTAEGESAQGNADSTGETTEAGAGGKF